MLYNTLDFAVFYGLVFGLYWFVFRDRLRIQNVLLLTASYVFYGWWDWRFLGLIAGGSLVDFVSSYQMSRTEDARRRKAWLMLSVVFNLGMLGFFKYFGFFVDSFIALAQSFGVTLGPRTLRVILPVGISFFVFQSLSYTIDVYRKRIKAATDPVAFLAFVSFFPQLVAGPIERASNLLPQFYKARRFDAEKAREGLRYILWGLFKKVVIADSLGQCVDLAVAHHEAYRGSVLAVSVFLFAIQLYCDFSGYSDMAYGTARLLGFDLMRNFNLPYFARDIFDFWRRWHISLTTWFRDYVFLPLSKGKTNLSKAMLIRNYLITFTVSGLWHGANWTYVIWGVLHGLYHIPYILFPQLKSTIQQTRPPYTVPGTVRAGLQIGLTLGLNLFALMFFMSPSVAHALSYMGHLFTPSLFQELNDFRLEFAGALAFLGLEWVVFHYRKHHPLEIGHWPAVLRWSVYYAMVLVILYFNYERRAFIYFQF
ncbi:MAG: MBOAT family O-acyltransferase [Bacteroidia bacterium]|nr:MBOAT family O-acyltransferase [Bacteroidia bacterium]